jgi:hypothetical protein
MRFGRGADRPSPVGDLAALIVTDLHTDFVAGGPLAVPGADDAAVGLSALVAETRRPTGIAGVRRTAIVVVEGIPSWRADKAGGGSGPYPPHGLARAEQGLLASVEPGVDCPYAWASCPAAGADPLGAGFDAMGQFVGLGQILERIAPSAISVAGLGLEHGGLAVAEALAGRADVTVLAGRSSFLDLDGARPRLDRLADRGVKIDWSPG